MSAEFMSCLYTVVSCIQIVVMAILLCSLWDLMRARKRQAKAISDFFDAIKGSATSQDEFNKCQQNLGNMLVARVNHIEGRVQSMDKRVEAIEDNESWKGN